MSGEVKRHWNRVALVGVGLLGGSIGLALRSKKLANEIVGIGRSGPRLAAARRRRVISQSSTSLAKGVHDADLVVVCTPVQHITSIVREVASVVNDACVITDVGSTKGSIASALQHLPNFVGSHPLAGSEQSGFEHSRDDLFHGRLVVVTPTRKTAENALHSTTQLWRDLGADVHKMTPQRHDQLLAGSSHLPHLVASAAAAAAVKNELPYVGSGWQDTTRIAAGDPDLWTQIFQDNRENLLASLQRFEGTLAEFRTALENDDERALARLLRKGKKNRESVGS